MAAGLAILHEMTPETYTHLNDLGALQAISQVGCFSLILYPDP
jgi:hypothetical protein